MNQVVLLATLIVTISVVITFLCSFSLSSYMRPGQKKQSKKDRPSSPSRANDHHENQTPVPETESTSAMEGSAAPRSPTTPTPTMTTPDTTAETTTPTSTEESHDIVLLFRTPPPTPTEEDEILFDNLTVLLLELILTVYLYHRRRTPSSLTLGLSMTPDLTDLH